MLVTETVIHFGLRVRNYVADLIDPPLPSLPISLLNFDEFLKLIRCKPVLLSLGSESSIEVKRPSKLSAEGFTLQAEFIEGAQKSAHAPIDLTMSNMSVVFVSCADGSSVSYTPSSCGWAMNAHDKVPALLQQVPELLRRLPELIGGLLVPLAHFVSGAANARQIKILARKSDHVLDSLRNPRMAELRRLYAEAFELVHFCRPRHARRLLEWHPGKLCEIRIAWFLELHRSLSISVRQMPGWRLKDRGQNFIESTNYALAAMNEIFLALFLDYSIRPALGRVAGFAKVALLKDRDDATRLAEIVKLRLEELNSLPELHKTLQALLLEVDDYLGVVRHLIRQPQGVVRAALPRTALLH
jgi:hypothetical protein